MPIEAAVVGIFTLQAKRSLTCCTFWGDALAFAAGLGLSE
ncbi:hypothetical protein QFZ30_002580 [Arthrobacter pascens]|nr:hypothetical protein [Arthrobacter pascens]